MTNTELKQIRLAMNLTQIQLAKLLHVTKLTVSRWENGHFPIPEDKAELLGYKQETHRIKKDNDFYARLKDSLI